MRYALNWIFISNPFTDSHRGIDLGWCDDTGPHAPVYSVADGTVIYSKFQNTGGYVLHIRHDNGFCSEYAHLQKGSIKVKIGDKVKMGQQIANMGNTGMAAYGYHLHLGIYKGSVINYSVDNWVNPIDYLEYYEGQKVYPPTLEKYHLKRHGDTPIPTDWTIGDYKLLVAKTIRTSCSLIEGNRVRVKDCTPATKKVLTSTRPNDIAMIRVGIVVTITRIYTDQANRIWGRYGNCWIVICNKDGTPQAQRV